MIVASNTCNLPFPGAPDSSIDATEKELYCTIGILEEELNDFSYQWGVQGNFDYLSNYEISNPVAQRDWWYDVTVTENTCGFTYVDNYFLMPCYVNTSDVVNRSFKVYPNPSSGIFNIENQGLQQQAHFRVTDLNGRTIQEQSGQLSNTELFSLRLGDVPSGMYFLMIQYDENVEVHRQIVQ